MNTVREGGIYSLQKSPDNDGYDSDGEREGQGNGEISTEEKYTNLEEYMNNTNPLKIYYFHNLLYLIEA